MSEPFFVNICSNFCTEYKNVLSPVISRVKLCAVRMRNAVLRNVQSRSQRSRARKGLGERYLYRNGIEECQGAIAAPAEVILT